MKKPEPDAEITHADEISPAELDAMAHEDESLAVDGDAGIVFANNTFDGGQLLANSSIHDLTTSPVTAHALDLASVNSKIVVVKSGDAALPKRLAVLMTPNGEQSLGPDDPAHKLAEGARIVKKAEGQFIAMQLSPADDRPNLETTTASDAIARFNQHFHDVKP